MNRFAALYRRLDRSTATLDKRAALVDYFRDAPPRDAAWALWLLAGGKIGGAKAKIASPAELLEWIAQESGDPPWLVEECREQVGDLAETLALLLDDPPSVDEAPLHVWIEQRLLAVAGLDPEHRRARITGAWRTLDFDQRLVFNKLLTGALRVGVSQRLVQQALAELSGVDIARIAQRMLGAWDPTPAFLETLLSQEALASDRQQPYPFFLASPLESALRGDPDAPAAEPTALAADASAIERALGDIANWLLEWKWDGIRLQLIRRRGEVALWSRGEERLDGRFPEIETAAARLGRDCVLDGELLAWREGDAPLPFTALQTRIQRLKPGPKTLSATPVRVLCYDLLELDGEDLRERPLAERRSMLEALLSSETGTAGPSKPAPAPDASALRIALSPRIAAASWHEAVALRAGAREREVEGLMLKRLSSPYRVGRRRGDWWKWKIDPLTVDAVLIYAQPGSGRRSTLYTDYTFGLWDGDALVPVAKAYSGLEDAEILELDRWIRAHTIERFGPVRSVQAQHVFELGFEAVNASSRHKSGVAVRFPRILRWRRDKRPADADGLQTLKALAR
jgi:DNA ligase-1